MSRAWTRTTWPARVSILALVISALILAAVLAQGSWGNKILLTRARGIVFAHYVSRSEFDAPPPVSPGTRGWLVDSREGRRWRSFISRDTVYARAIERINAIPGTMDRAEAVARLVATNGQSPFPCGIMGQMRERLHAATCCSDHTQLFRAVAPLVRLTARETSNVEHTVIEVYDSTSTRWEMLDVAYGFRLRNRRGVALSMSEVRDAKERGEQLDQYAFTNYSLQPTTAAAIDTFYHPSQFKRLMITGGDNVLIIDEWAARLSFLPKVLARSVSYVFGIGPSFYWLSDSMTESDLRKDRLLRAVAIALAGALIAGLACWPLARANKVVQVHFARRRTRRLAELGT